MMNEPAVEPGRTMEAGGSWPIVHIAIFLNQSRLGYMPGGYLRGRKSG
jgi:hypothetical protein